MRAIRLSAVLFCAAFTSFSTAASANDAESILRKVQEKKIERWKGVNNYTVDQSTAGSRVLLYYERIETKTADGPAAPAFRLVPIDEISDRQAAAQGITPLTAEQLNEMAKAYRYTGAGMSSAMEQEMQKAGLPPGLLRATGNPNEPWLSLDPQTMLGGMADFLDFTADARREMEARDVTAEAREDAADMADFARAARLVGEETVDGRRAFLLRAGDLNRVQKVDGEEFTIQTVSLWIDGEEYVPLRMKVDGVAKSGRETRAMAIERDDLDYRKIGTMYEPHRQVMRIVGVMNAKEEADMRKAQKEMAEFERQMEQMPAAQRQMIMGRMGPQMEMMKKMAAGGGIETVTEVHSIRVNAGLPDQMDMARAVLGDLAGQ